MEQELDLHSIDPQTLDPKQEEELLASLSEEELEEVAGGTYISGGHICGSSGYYDSYEEARYDFEVGTRVQVTRAPQLWSSWSATIIGRTIEKKAFPRVGTKYCVMYLVHFDNTDKESDNWYNQNRLYI